MNDTLNYANPSLETAKPDIEQLHELLPALAPAQQLGVALVGLGTYSTEQLAPALLEAKFCRLAGIVTGSPSKIPEWKGKYSIPDTNIYSYENFDRIRDNPEIDIVYVALPNALHAGFVIRAAKAGKHVICEKPMGLTVAECDDMIAACKAAGKLLSVGYRLHYDPVHTGTIKLIREQTFGETEYIHAKHGRCDVNGWRLDKRLAGGGPLMDLGIYCIQAACYVTGQEPIAVKATEWERAEKDNPEAIENFLSWEMEMPGGLIVKCETSYTDEASLLYTKARHGWLELSPAYSYKGVIGKTATGFLNFPAVNQQTIQMDDFSLSVLYNKPVKLPGEMGRRDVKIIRAIYESMKSGNRIGLTDF